MNDEILRKEWETFQSMKPELLPHHLGKFILIHDGKFIDAFDTRSAAYDFGIRKFGNVPLFISQLKQNDDTETMPALKLGVLHVIS
jgi:hypothetical protein